MAQLNETHKQVEWLAKQGARVVSSTPLRRAFYNPISNWFKKPDSMTAMETLDYQSYTESGDEMLNIDVPASVVKIWQSYESRLDHITKDADRYGVTPVQLELVQRKRHMELLHQNPMYHEAWLEFQSIRALLGETTNWP